MSDEVNALVEENRRLRRDVRLLGERVSAIERSRWWRLHPRFLLKRRREDEPTGDAVAPAADQATAVPDDGARRFADEVVSQGTFGHDYFTHHIPTLEPLVDELAGTGASILEIGSFDGLSTCYFLWRLPDATLTCVDHFAGSPESGSSDAGLEVRFDRNVRLVDASWVQKRVGDSRRVLPSDRAFAQRTHFEPRLPLKKPCR